MMDKDAFLLDGVWDFAFTPSPSDTPDYNECAAVPGCFDAAGLRYPRQGCGWYRRRTDVGTDLDEAKKFLDQKAPVHWEAAFMRIESALVKAAKAGSTAEVNDAVRMLASLREAQTVWYNQQKLSYLEAKVSGRKETMMSIQSLSESAFTPLFQDFDFRYELIKRRDWQ